MELFPQKIWVLSWQKDKRLRIRTGRRIKENSYAVSHGEKEKTYHTQTKHFFPFKNGIVGKERQSIAVSEENPVPLDVDSWTIPDEIDTSEASSSFRRSNIVHTITKAARQHPVNTKDQMWKWALYIAGGIALVALYATGTLDALLERMTG